MTRFAVPILLLLILAGLTFWANVDSRVDTAMTILLSVSALYVVIIGNIPQLGYLTIFDTWIFTMYVTLVLCVCAHQAVLVVLRKGNTWPMRTAMTRVIEMSGRVILVPFMIIIYWKTFVRDPSLEMDIACYLTVCLIFLFLLAREYGGVRKAVKIAIGQVCEKIDSEKDHRLSKFELGMFNLFAFGVLNVTTKPYRQRKKRRARAKLELEMNTKKDTFHVVTENSTVDNALHSKKTFREAAGDENLADSDDDSD